MKPKNYFILILLSIAQVAFSQTTIIIQPDSVQGVDAFINNWPGGNYQNLNFGNSIDFDGIAWTANGTPYLSRSLINFYLGAIPPSAIITHAQLSLYHNPNSNQTGSAHQTLSGPNDFRIERITSPWNEDSVTWNTQPTTTLVNAVYLPASTSGTQDYLNIDVTGLVNDIFVNGASSYGMMLRLNNETQYRSVVFCSTDHPNVLSHPKLEITYVDSATCIVMQPDSNDGVDAYVSNWIPGNYANLNFGSYADYDAIAWTDGGDPYIGRGLLKFNFSTIPSNATVVTARLSLYNNPTSSQTGGQHYSLSGSNDSRIERITSYWDENLVTWNTQPTTTLQNAVFIPQSTSPNQDYLNIDVKNLVVDMINDSANSFGFMIMLNVELEYRALVFASSDHADSLKHPKMEICYTVPTSIHLEDRVTNKIEISPNPVVNYTKLIVYSDKYFSAQFSLSDVAGRLIGQEWSSNINAGKNTFDISQKLFNLNPGIYFIQSDLGSKKITVKIIKQD